MNIHRQKTSSLWEVIYQKPAEGVSTWLALTAGLATRSYHCFDETHSRALCPFS
jgi:hypothetical protein